MTPALRKALIVAIVHVLLVASLGAKLLIDRSTRPRVWARTAPIDPDLPIRGRYVRLQIEAYAPHVPESTHAVPVTLSVQVEKLYAESAPGHSEIYARPLPGRGVVVLRDPLAFFIPEDIPDPSLRQPGEELWVEVTLPRRGPPRPIRLGVVKDGALTVIRSP